MFSDRLVKGLWVALSVAILALQFRIWSGEGSLSQMWGLDHQIAGQQAENVQLSDRNRALAAEVMELRLAQSALEERARVQLGMVHPDETFYLVIGH
ncbi:MAG: septum formation initiator family protein [Hahellaceae bacterium]|nr:septum formation initiator family protein [Hahellaceae bacterium]